MSCSPSFTGSAVWHLFRIILSLLTWSPTFAEFLTSLSVLLCICLCDRVLADMSSAKSRSPNDYVNVHMTDWRICLFSSTIIQSIARENRNGDYTPLLYTSHVKLFVLATFTSSVSRGFSGCPENPPARIFLIRGVTPLLAPTLTRHLHLRRSETPLEPNSGYATAYTTTGKHLTTGWHF